jgi:hypothetical protein
MAVRTLSPALLIIIAGSLGLNGQQAAVAVPFVGCETVGQVHMEAPKGTTSPSISISPGVAAKLAYYKSSNGLGILAPRGWSCLGTIGSGGDQLLVTSSLDRAKYFSNAWDGFHGQVVQLVRSFGDTSGRLSVAEIIMRIFPSHRAFAEDVARMFPDQKFPAEPYPGDTLIRKSGTVVEYTTPALTDGLGTYRGLRKNSGSINGVAILIEQATPDVVLLSMRLSADFADATSTIMHQVERDTAQHPQARY